MKKLIFPAFLLAACLSRAQYTTVTGTPGNVSGTFVVETLYGPMYGDHDFVLHNFAWCKGYAGNEPCPWTLPFQSLYDNSWDNVVTRWIYLAPGASVNAVSSKSAQWNDQEHTRISDGTKFKRSYKWETWPEEKVWFN